MEYKKILDIDIINNIKNNWLKLDNLDLFPLRSISYREYELSSWKEKCFDFTIPIMDLNILIEIYTNNWKITETRIYKTNF